MDESVKYARMCKRIMYVNNVKFHPTMVGGPWKLDDILYIVKNRFDCYHKLLSALHAFDDYSSTKKVKYSKKFDTLEQLALAFVMKETYNQVWTGRSWKKENEK